MLPHVGHSTVEIETITLSGKVSHQIKQCGRAMSDKNADLDSNLSSPPSAESSETLEIYLQTKSRAYSRGQGQCFHSLRLVSPSF